MTIEEKAKAYDRALEIAKAWHKLDNNDLSNDDLETLFPELKESEDERIRKELIAFLKTYNTLAVSRYISWLEKQCEKKPNSKDKSALEAINEIKLDNANKIESKFKVGDWIVQDNIGIYKIVEVCESWYEVIDNQNNHYSIGFDKEYMCHLWTMQDAKDGDTLVDEDNNIGIYKEIDSICWHSYIYLGYDNCLYGFNIGGHHMQNSTKPATREQRDNLFKKINEAGYVWYPNSKELYKLIRIHYD